MPSTLTPQYIVDVVSTSKGMKPLVNVGGIANQPGLSICNQTLQKLLCSPYAWRFNKNSIGVFTTIANQQDYIVSGCNIVRTGRWALYVNAQNSPNGAGLTQAGTTVTATFNDFAPNGFPAGAGPVIGDPIVIAGAKDPKYNISATVTAATASTLQYTAAGGATTPDGGQGISNINWMEHVTLSDFQSSATVIPVHDVEIAASLPMESIIQPPMKFAYQVDTVFTGSNLTITCPLMRAWPVPSSQIWGVYLFFQAKAPRIADLTLGSWTPFPDDLEFVLVSGVKAMALDWWEDPRSANSLIIFKQDILTALGAKDQELRHESMFPDLPLVRGG